MTRLPARTRGPVRAHASPYAPPARSGSRNGDNETTNGALDETQVAALKLLRFPAVRERTGLSRSTIWRLERQGAFPRHHRISANAVAWIEDDIANWIRSKVTGVAV
jgi:prophage regulatory protein